MALITRQGSEFVLEVELWLDRPPKDVFPFFADAFNLERITPPWLRFQVLTPAPIEMRVGTLIDYKLRVRGLPIRWRTLIEAWDPPHRFIDRQLRGPYRLWHHEHTFEDHKGGTLCRDRVRFLAPGGAMLHRLWVNRDVAAIFRYRQAQLLSILNHFPMVESREVSRRL